MRFFFRSPESYRSAGDRARDQRLWKKGASKYAKYLEANPGDAAIWVQYGHCLKEGGDYGGASNAYQRALSFMPRDADLHVQIGHLNKIAGRVRAAIASYRAALDIDPNIQSAHNELASLQPVVVARERRVLRADETAFNDVLKRLESLEERVSRLESQGSRQVPAVDT
jgi:tetratricopeptide (TPR) repeat protein